MTTQPDDDDGRGPRYLHGPAQSDIERYSAEDYEERHAGRRRAGPVVWKLVAGAVFIIFAVTMLLNVLLPAINGKSSLTVATRTTGRVTGVLDSHTITVDVNGSEKTVRYIGVDPLTSAEPFYSASIAANQQWLSDQEVELEADAQDTDPDGRLLRYVWLNDAMINLNLVGVGLARAADSGPNRRYASLFQQVEQNARAQGLGVWGGDTDRPQVSARGAMANPAGDILLQ